MPHEPVSPTPLLARAALAPARLAAERRGPRRVRDLRLRAQGRDARAASRSTLALANLQKMLHRAGNVDGEGDGCGLLVDIPRKIWAEEVRAGGHNPALALDPAFAVAHVFIERSQDLDAGRSTTPARSSAGAASASSPSASARSTRRRWGRPRARRSRTSGRSPGSSPTPSAATASSSTSMIELEQRARLPHRPRSRRRPASTR